VGFLLLVPGFTGSVMAILLRAKKHASGKLYAYVYEKLQSPSKEHGLFFSLFKNTRAK